MNQLSFIPFQEASATAKMICDSTYKNSRLCSIEVEFPRPYLAEFNTHTRFSRNSASSRAIPVWKRLLAILERPYVPNSFGTNKAGMLAGEILSNSDQEKAVANWLVGRDIAVIQAFFLAGGFNEITGTSNKAGKEREGLDLCAKVDGLIKKYSFDKHLFNQDRGMHKQHANRVLEPYAYHTVLVTSSYWRNFFGLRASTKAQPEAQDFGIVIAQCMMNSTPAKLEIGQWHMPYIRDDDKSEEPDQLILARASSGKSARTSYLTHDGIRALVKDLELADDLTSSGHMSPFQHPARPKEDGDPINSHGNYSPVWTQLRKLMYSEDDFTKLISRDELIEGCRGNVTLADYILSIAE